MFKISIKYRPKPVIKIPKGTGIYQQMLDGHKIAYNKDIFTLDEFKRVITNLFFGRENKDN